MNKFFNAFVTLGLSILTVCLDGKYFTNWIFGAYLWVVVLTGATLYYTTTRLKNTANEIAVTDSESFFTAMLIMNTVNPFNKLELWLSRGLYCGLAVFLQLNGWTWSAAAMLFLLSSIEWMFIQSKIIYGVLETKTANYLNSAN